MADPPGISVAFSAGPLAVSPTWTRLDTLTGLRVQEWSVSRGRPDEFAKTQAGTAQVRIADVDGVLDPTNAGSSYTIRPDQQASISLHDPVLSTWHSVFRGYVESVVFDVQSFTFDSGDVVDGVLFITLNLVDAFGWLNDHELQPYPAAGDTPPAGSEGRVFYEETSGSVDDRIIAILTDVGWPSGLWSIFSGNVDVCDTVYEPGTPSLAALFDAADAEFPNVANLFVSKTGIVTFHGRQARFRPDVAGYGIQRRTVGDPSATAGDSTIAPISELGFDLGKDHLYNSVLAVPQEKSSGVEPTGVEVAAQLLEDSTSITAHGVKSLVFNDLLTLVGRATGNDGLQETALMGQYFIDNYAALVPRINRMVFKSKLPSHPLAGPLWKQLCRCEISDLLTVQTAHKGGGGFTSLGYYVEGIRYTCRPGNNLVPIVEQELDVSPQAFYTTNPFDTDPDP